MKRVFTVLAATVFAGCVNFAAFGLEWPQYRGPEGDGISKENIKLGPGAKVVWKAPMPNGFSSFTVANGQAYTQIGTGPTETVVAVDAATGKPRWTLNVDNVNYQKGGDSGAQDNKGGDGPRSTPVVSDGKVYVYSSGMTLYCIDAKAGKTAWKHDMIEEFGGKNIAWSNAISPVVDGDLVYVSCGGSGQSFVAFKKATGEVAWKSGTETNTHATPVVATLFDVKQVIFFVKSGLVSVDAATGQELWRHPFKFSTSTAASPVVCGKDIVYCSAGYDVGGGACKISKSGSGFTATELYYIKGNKNIPNHWSTPVYKDGYLYGMFSFKRYGVGPLKCVEAATGKIMWEQPNFGAGNVILANNRLVALADDGQVYIVDPTPTGYKELGKAQVVAGKCWSTPALADGKIYVRSTKEGACLDVSGK